MGEAEAVPELPPSSDDASAWPLLLQVVVLGTVAGASWWGAERTTGVPHVVLAVLLVAAGGLFLYLVGLLLVFHLVVRLIDGMGRSTPEGWRDRLPMGVRLLAVVLLLSWAVSAWLSGYDAAQWLTTGVSVLLADAVLVLVLVRRRRAQVPDGPDGPRHRRPPD